MAKKKLLGMEIGNNRIKIAQCLDTNLERMVISEIPDNIVLEDTIVSWEAMADFIKDVVKSNNISYKEVAMVLPEKESYIKRLTMPAMTVEQLRVNLPFEFHDYITEDKDKYFYDYSVIEIKSDEEGQPKEMELMAVAASKELVEHYKTMFRRAGLRLVLLAPEFAAYKNIIKEYEENTDINKGVAKDYAILDLGHRLLRLHFFTKGEYEVSRKMEPACGAIARAIAEKLGVDIHIAQINQEQNKDDILSEPECVDIYNQMAIEIMRVLNFYNFNHPENSLDTLYYCGGGSKIKPLIDAIEAMIDIKVESITEILADDIQDKEAVMMNPQPLGIAWE